MDGMMMTSMYLSDEQKAAVAELSRSNVCEAVETEDAKHESPLKMAVFHEIFPMPSLSPLWSSSSPRRRFLSRPAPRLN